LYEALCLRYGGYGWRSCTQEKFRREAHALTPFMTADLSQGATGVRPKLCTVGTSEYFGKAKKFALSCNATALSTQRLAHRITGLLVTPALVEAKRPLAFQVAGKRSRLAPFAAGDAFHVVHKQRPVSLGPRILLNH
jgi:hypothetical protein